MRFILQLAIVTFVSGFFSVFVHGAEAGKCDGFSSSRRNDPARKARLDALKAIAPYKAYFEAIGGRLHERQFVIELAELALLAKEHVLLMGPPGTAKSLIADTILGNILERATDKNSYFRIQMTPETTISETHGPLDFKKLQETGVYVRILEESAFLSKTNFIDEIFDARANGLRNMLGLLNERAHAQGTHITKGKLETAIAATNLYFSQVYEKAGDDKPKAAIDRFAFSAFVPGEFADTSSYISLIRGAGLAHQPLPKFYFDELDSLRELVKQVEITEPVAKFLALLTTKMKAEIEATEQSSLSNYKKKLKDGEEPGIPYRSTKYFNPRTAASKAGGVLKAIVVRDWIQKKGKRRLEATLDDVRELRKFFVLNGPNANFVNGLLERSTNADERTQLQTIQLESQVFDHAYNDLMDEANRVLVHYSLHDLQLEVEMAPEAGRTELSKKIISFILALDDEANPNTPHAERSGRDIGVGLVREQYVDLLAQTLGGRAEADQIMANLEKERRLLIARRQAEEERERREQERIRLAEERRLEAERAEVEAREQKAKEEREAFVTSFSSKSLAWQKKMPISDPSSVRTGHNESLNLVAVLDASNGTLKMIDVTPDGENRYSSQDYVLELDSNFASGNFDDVRIIDKNTILLLDQAGKVAQTIDLTSMDVTEVPLYIGSEHARAAYHPDSNELITIGRSEFTKGKLGDVGRKKGSLKFETSELESDWNSVIDGQFHPPQMSSDGKYLTVLEYHGSKAFVINVEDMKVISSETLLTNRGSLYTDNLGNSGSLFYSTSASAFLVADKQSSPVVYRLVNDASQVRYSTYSRYGIAFLSGANLMISGSNSQMPVLLSLSDSSAPTTTQAQARASYAPIVLKDGRIVTYYMDADKQTWHVGILK